MKKINKEYNKELKHHSFYKVDCFDKYGRYIDRGGVIQSCVDGVTPDMVASGGADYAKGFKFG